MKNDYGGHNVNFYNNIVVTLPYDNQNCLNLGDFVQGGPGDNIYSNKFVLFDGEKLGTIGQCFKGTPVGSWNNSYYTARNNGSYKCWVGNKYEMTNISTMQQQYGMELNSTANYLPSNQTILEWATSLLQL